MVLASFTDTEIQQNEAEPQTLFFPGLEIHLKEQTVYKDGIQIPFSYYEFFTLLSGETFRMGVYKKADLRGGVEATG